jgi:flagellar biosynthetic protein FliP
MTRFLGAILFLLLTAAPASAQVPSLESLIPAGDASAAGRIIQLILVITVLSVAPGLLIMLSRSRFCAPGSDCRRHPRI